MYVARWLWHENGVHGTALGQGSSTFKKCPNDTWSEPSKQLSPNEAVHAAAQAVMSGTHDCCMAPSRKEVCMWMQCAKSCCANRCRIAWIKLHHPRHAGCSLLIHPRNKYQPAMGHSTTMITNPRLMARKLFICLHLQRQDNCANLHDASLVCPCCALIVNEALLEVLKPCQRLSKSIQPIKKAIDTHLPMIVLEKHVV